MYATKKDSHCGWIEAREGRIDKFLKPGRLVTMEYRSGPGGVSRDVKLYSKSGRIIL